MNKRIILLCNLLAANLFASADILKFPDIIADHHELKSTLHQVIDNSSYSDKEQLLQNLQSKQNCSQLPFKMLNLTLFEETWYPEQKNALYNSPEKSSLSDENVFIANILYEMGKIDPDKSRKHFCWEQAAAHGHPRAQYEMFKISHRQDKITEARNYLESAAAQKDTKALFRLGTVYEGYWDIGIEQDIKKARDLYQQAAQQDHHRAQFTLAVTTYLKGSFEENVNFKKGVQNAQDLCRRGNLRAKQFIQSIMNRSSESLQETYDDLTEDDFNFLRESLGWRDENDDISIKD